jgi:hypothetical protein
MILKLPIFSHLRSLDETPKSFMCEECLIYLSPEERMTDAVKCQVSFFIIIIVVIINIIIVIIVTISAIIDIGTRRTLHMC